MIDVKDLMVGNVILCNGLRTIINNSLMKDIINKETIWTIEPLKLTESILMKCGFKKLKQTEYTVNTFELDGIRIWVKNGRFYVSSLFPIDYLHELQQLYKILAKQELEIEL